MAAPSSNSSCLRGVLERIIFLNEENHYTIAELRPDSDGPPPPAAPQSKSAPASRVASAPARPAKPADSALVTVVGTLPGVQCGETLALDGEWIHHPQHGAQFKIVTWRSELPASVYGIRKYLGSGLVPGIGKTYANKIVARFGADTLRVISEESARLREVPGIGPSRATAIKKSWEDQRALREILIFLQTYGVTPSQCVKLVGRYGPQAKSILLAEPYRVAREIDGIGFKTADKIAINLGFANDAPPRLDAGLLYALAELAEEGHTAFGENDLRAYTAELLQTDPNLLAARIAALVESRDLVRHTPSDMVGRALRPPSESSVSDTVGRALRPPSESTLPAHISAATAIQLPLYHRAEEKIATAVVRVTRAGSCLPPIKVEAAIVWAQEQSKLQFADHQVAALRAALTSKVSILTGGPGTGKTATLRALVGILKAKKVRVHLAAPTGRAAKRIAETTGGFAQTIHRLLKYDPAKSGFLHDSASPLPTDFLVVDEASMLDTRLAASLLQAVPSSAHILLVGDVDQLPSVGAGNVLKDLIASGLAPVTRLAVIFRQQQQSQIVVTAHAVNHGDATLPPTITDFVTEQLHHDLLFVPVNSAEECIARVIELCTKVIPQKLRHFDPVAEVQVLAPMHKGVAGVGNLNRALQQALNPNGLALRSPAGELRAGDKLIQLRNNYDKGIFNGDIAVVTAVDSEDGTLEADFDGTKQTLDRGDLGDVALAYACSIHKCVDSATWILTESGWKQIGTLWPSTTASTSPLRSLDLRLAGPDGLVMADQIYRGPVEPALRITTRHGYNLTGSHRHPVLVYSPETGEFVWKKTPEIKIGDFLPVRRALGVFPAEEVAISYHPAGSPLRHPIKLPPSLNADIAIMLGYLVGDGSYAERQDGDVRLTNADRPLVDNFLRVLVEQFGLEATLSRSTAQRTAPTWYVINKSFREWLAAAGLGYATARDKKVPAAVLQSPRAVQATFLRGLFDTDGSASGNGTRVVLATTAPLLADQVRMMLLNLGIITALLHIKASDSWRVEMYGANLRLFEKEIGFGLPAKAAQLRAMARRADGWNEKTNVDIIPGAARLWNVLLTEIKARLGPTKGRKNRGLHAKDFLTHGKLLHTLAAQRTQTNYRHLGELLDALVARWPWAAAITAFARLSSLRSSHHFFDPVKRIEPTTAAMFDLHVPGTHSFVTNGLISHNSQGSEYPVVIVPLLKGHFMMLQRNLLYTAITRGKKRVFIVGEPAAWGMAVRNNESRDRRTHLREKLATLSER